MTSLKSLAKSIKERIYPRIFEAVYQQKKKLQKLIIISGVVFASSFGLATQLPNDYATWLVGLGSISGLVAFFATIIPYNEICFTYRGLLKLDDDEHLNSVPFLSLNTEYQQLTQQEMESLLSIALSDENLKILNEAISGAGYIIYDDIVDMTNQEQYETEALQHHAQFVEAGNYNNSQQQTNLQKLARLNTSKLPQNYKTFNSKAVL